MLLDFTIQSDVKMEGRRSGIAIIDKIKETKIIGVTIPGDERREIGTTEK